MVFGRYGLPDLPRLRPELWLASLLVSVCVTQEAWDGAGEALLPFVPLKGRELLVPLLDTSGLEELWLRDEYTDTLSVEGYGR